MARRSGRKLFEFPLFGHIYEVREAPRNSKVLRRGKLIAVVHVEERIIYVRNSYAATLEQQQTAITHEVEHIIEDHYHVDHRNAKDEDQSDDVTDKLSLGWLYIIRGAPTLLEFLRCSVRPS